MFPADIAKFLRTGFFIEHLQWLLLTVLPQYSRVSWGVSSLISRLHVYSILINNLHECCTNTMWYHVSKDFLCLHFVDGQVLSISGYDLENGRKPYKQKYWIKNLAVKIPILILFHFCLLCWLSPVSVVAASCFNYIGPCFRSF